MPSKKKTAKKKADDVKVDDDALEEENEDAKGGCHDTDVLPSCGETPAPQKLPQITVARLLNETQLGVSMHKRITQQMTRLRTENPEKFLRDTCQCLLHVLLVYKVRPSSFTSFTWRGGLFFFRRAFRCWSKEIFPIIFNFFVSFFPLFSHYYQKAFQTTLSNKGKKKS